MDNNNMEQPNNTSAQNYQQNTYQQPTMQSMPEMEEPVSMGEWLISMLILAIPCVNIIMLFVWAFGNGAKKSKSNYFKACLIMAAISFALVILITILFGGAMSAAMYRY